MEVRSLIVGHVVNDWTKFSVMSHNRNGDNYSTANEYYADMIKNETYGVHLDVYFHLILKFIEMVSYTRRPDLMIVQ